MTTDAVRLGRFGAGELLTILVLVVGGIVWAVRLEGRVDGQAKELAEVRVSAREGFDQVRADLAYIRSRIDQAVEGR